MRETKSGRREVTCDNDPRDDHEHGAVWRDPRTITNTELSG
jgi:hypothetical protein